MAIGTRSCHDNLCSIQWGGGGISRYTVPAGSSNISEFQVPPNTIQTGTSSVQPANVQENAGSAAQVGALDQPEHMQKYQC